MFIIGVPVHQQQVHTIKDRYENHQSISQDALSETSRIGHLYSPDYPVSDPKQLARLHDQDRYEMEFDPHLEGWPDFDIAPQ